MQDSLADEQPKPVESYLVAHDLQVGRRPLEDSPRDQGRRRSSATPTRRRSCLPVNGRSSWS